MSQWQDPDRNFPPDYVHELLSHNNPPPEAHVHQILEDLSNAENRLRGFQQTTSGKGKSQARKQLVLDVHNLKSILSPLRRLPSEITGEIFVHIVEQNYADTDSLSTAIAPWTLAQTCARWRRVALSMSRLWGTVFINSARVAKIGPEASLLLLNTWISRSGTTTLKVHIQYVNAGGLFRDDDSGELSDDNVARGHFRPLMDAIVAQSHRWSAFHLEGWEDASAIRDCFDRVPSLRELQLDQCPPLYMYLHFFSRAPLLRDVRIYSIENGPEPEQQLPGLSPALFPWHQLTTYRYYGPSDIITQFDALQKAQKLQEYSCLCEWGRVETPPPSPIAFSQLLFVTLSGVSHFLDALICPSIEKLDIADMNTSNDLYLLSRFIDRSACSSSLISLNIEGILTLGIDIIPILQSLPSLMSLKFDGELGLRLIIAHLLVEERQKPLVPKLKKLEISAKVALDEPYDTDLIVGMLESRWFRVRPSNKSTTVTRLRTVRLVIVALGHGRRESLDFFSRVERLRETGMTLRITEKFGGEYNSSDTSDRSSSDSESSDGSWSLDTEEEEDSDVDEAA